MNNINEVLATIEKFRKLVRSHIQPIGLLEPHELIRVDGERVTQVPNFFTVSLDRISLAHAVYDNKYPVFNGSQIFYTGPVTNIEREGFIQSADDNYFKILFKGEVLPTTISRREFFLYAKPFKTQKPKAHLNDCTVNRPLKEKNSDNQFPINDSKGTTYWVSSVKEIEVLQNQLQIVVDDLLYALAEGKNVRILISDPGTGKIVNVPVLKQSK